jgi:hypothetical protein
MSNMSPICYTRSARSTLKATPWPVPQTTSRPRAPRRSVGRWAADLGLDIVGFNIEVHPTRVLYDLHLDVQAMLRVLEPFVGITLAGRQLVHRHAEGSAPKIGGAAKIAALAIDDESAKFAFVHCFLQIL